MRKFTQTKDRHGFSLVEVLVVMAIFGTLAAILIPTALQQRHRSTDAAMKADVLQVQVGIKQALSIWKDVPPGNVPITFSSPAWSVVYGSSTLASGKASPGDTISGTLWSDASYCVQATNTNGSNNWILRSDTDQISSGSCPGTALGAVGTLPTTTTATVPTAVTGLTVSNTSGVSNSVDVSWTIVTGATSYSVSAMGPNSETTVNVIAPSVSVTIPNLDGGLTTIVVQALNASGSSINTSMTITVNGGIISNAGLTSPVTVAAGSSTSEGLQVGTSGINPSGSTLTSDASTIQFGTNAALATAAWIAGRSDGGINFYTQSSGGSIINNLSMTTTGNVFNNAVTIADGTASTNPTTGALTVTGGSGISGALNVGGSVTVTGSCIGCGSSISIADDNVTNASYYLLEAMTNSGIASAVKTSSAKLYFNPSTGTAKASVFGSTTSNTATLTPNGDTGGFLVNTVADTNKGLVIKSNSSAQTANIFEMQSNAGSVLSALNPNGNFFATGLEFKSRVQATTIGASLTVTYSNGSSGVGATLTNAGTQVAFAIDGYTAGVGSRILIKDQTSASQNGIYTVTTLGSASTNWVLTRATDSDTATKLASDLVAVDQGTINAGTFWRTTFQSTNTVGSTGLTWIAVVSPAPPIVDDVSSTITEYLALATATSGSLAAIKTSSSKLSFNSSTGSLSTGGDALVNGMTIGTGNNSSNTNTAFGQLALSVSSANTNDTAIGIPSQQNGVASGNTTVGAAALYNDNNAAAINNTAFGYAALQTLNSGYGNIAFGYAVINQSTSNQNNYDLSIGYTSGLTLYGGVSYYDANFGAQAGYYDSTTSTNDLNFGVATGPSVATPLNNVINIGNVGSVASYNNLSLISGIQGTTVAGSIATFNGLLHATSGFNAAPPNIQSGATYTVVATDYSIIETTANLTITLPTCDTASGDAGRILLLRNGSSANSIVASIAVVIPLGSATTGTSIIPAVAGKFAELQCQGSSGNWYINASN